MRVVAVVVVVVGVAICPSLAYYLPPSLPPSLLRFVCSFHGLVEIMIMALTGSWQEAKVRVFLTWLFAATEFIVVVVVVGPQTTDVVGSLGAAHPAPLCPGHSSSWISICVGFLFKRF